MLLQVHIPALSAKTDAAEMAVDEVLIFCLMAFLIVLMPVTDVRI